MMHLLVLALPHGKKSKENLNFSVMVVRERGLILGKIGVTQFKDVP